MVDAAPRDPGDLTGVRVCIVGMHYAPESTGNAPYTTAMAQALTSAGARVRVVTGVPHYPRWKVDAEYRRGLRWHEVVDGVRLVRHRHAVPSVPSLVGRARMELSFAALALQAVLRDRSDVVVAVTPMLSALTISVVARRRRPLGVLVQDLTGNGASQSGATGGLVGRLIARAEYALLRRADRVGVIAPRFAEILVGAGVESGRVVDLPNFAHIVPVEASRRAARARLGWDPDARLAVHTGNIGLKQGLETVVEAARLSAGSADPVHFVVVGDGNRRADLERLGAGVPTLHFVDPLPAADYPYALAAADVLVLNERAGMVEMSLPSKLTSYVASGRPVVAAVEAGSITEKVVADAGVALVAPAGDPAGLLAAVTRVLGDEELRSRLVAAGDRMYRGTYSAEAAHERYRRFVADLLGVRRRAEVRT